MRLDEGECRRRLAVARVARLATVGGDQRPHIVPITFALRDDQLVTAVDQKPKSTTRLRRLRNIADNPRVSVLVDRYEDDWSLLWWVRADGRATIVDNDEANRDAIEALADKYVQYRDDPPHGPVVIVEIVSWTGWSY